jgi:tetratricopeptide (TPR) repeat protein
VKRLIAMVLGTTMGISAWSESSKNGLMEANAALQAGEADKALVLLYSLPQPQAASAQAHNLRCRVLFALEEWDSAANECQQAVNLDGQNSDDHMWLGRALGEKADRASFVSAYGLAKRTRAEFETAVQLNPRNAEALADLGEFYKSAPGVVGGGVSKAQAVAAQLDKIDPPRAHELRGRIAAGNQDYDGAEREFKQAIAVSQHPAFQWTTLASFYRKRERWNDMESALKSTMEAVERDRHAGVALYNGASLLIKTKRDPVLAAKMLDAYLAGPTKTEEAPAFVAHLWLARLDAQLGDAAAARRERAAALALANEYKPAHDLKERSE